MAKPWFLKTGFTGVDQPYEEPLHPDVKLKAGELSIDQCVQEVVQLLSKNVSLSADQLGLLTSQLCDSIVLLACVVLLTEVTSLCRPASLCCLVDRSY